MMEMMNAALPLERNNATTAMPLEALRSPVEAPAQTSSRQAEVTPGVEVQISSAAREAAARDPLTAAPSSSEPAQSAFAAAGVLSSAGPAAQAANPAAPQASPETGTLASTADSQTPTAQNRLMQMFTETAGIGVGQANTSPLRDIA